MKIMIFNHFSLVENNHENSSIKRADSDVGKQMKRTKDLLTSSPLTRRSPKGKKHYYLYIYLLYNTLNSQNFVSHTKLSSKSMQWPMINDVYDKWFMENFSASNHVVNLRKSKINFYFIFKLLKHSNRLNN